MINENPSLLPYESRSVTIFPCYSTTDIVTTIFTSEVTLIPYLGLLRIPSPELCSIKFIIKIVKIK